MLNMEEVWNLLISVLLVFFLFFGLRLLVQRRAKKLIGKEFEGLSEGIVYFYSPRCGACKRMNPVVDKLSKEIKVLKIDITTSEGNKLARRYNIFGTPTTFIVKNGKVVEVILGTTGYEEFRKVIEKYTSL